MLRDLADSRRTNTAIQQLPASAGTPHRSRRRCSKQDVNRIRPLAHRTLRSHVQFRMLFRAQTVCCA